MKKEKKQVIKKRITSFVCIILALITLLPFNLVNTNAATTRYCDAKFTIAGKTTVIRCRFGNSPNAWFASNQHSGTIKNASGNSTSNSNGINASRIGRTNWYYVSVTITIPKGYYCNYGNTTNNFNESTSSATMQTKVPSGQTKPSIVKNNGQLLTPSTSDTVYNFGLYWNNSHTIISTTKGTSYKAWTYTPITYSVKYNGNGSTGGSMSNSSHTYDTAKALTANAFTKTGHTFAGWATSASGGVVYADKASVKNLTASNGATVNLYAKWTANKYTYTFVYGNGSANTTGTKTYGTAYTLPSAPTRTGYSFAGWKSGTSGKVYSAGASCTEEGGRTFTAQWTANKYTYTFVYGNGSADTTGTKTYGTAYTLPSAPTRTGYTFTGWKSGTSGTVYSAGASCTEEGDRTFTAQWKSATYNITYNGNGAEKGSMDTVIVSSDTDYKLDLCKYGRAGYTFLGWSLSDTATAATYEDEATVNNLTTVGGATVTLYAIWEVDDSPEINMFTGCFKIQGEAGTTYDKKYVNHKRANIDVSGDPGYFTRK